MKTVVVLGGYGNFGKRIVEGLSGINNTTVVVAGRNKAKAQDSVNQHNAAANATVIPAQLDIDAADFAMRLGSLNPDIVIHTSGPFQGQSHRVPNICIDLGAHYIDLADDRRFVCDIGKLDTIAIQRGVLIVSGASTVPGISSAAIDCFCDEFATLNSIDNAIARGKRRSHS